MDLGASQEAKHKMMTGEKIPGLITHLSVPTIGSMLITALYSIADTFFVSQIGTSASGAVGSGTGWREAGIGALSKC